MILKTDTISIDVDQVVAILDISTKKKQEFGVCIAGGWITVKGECGVAVQKAFDRLHQSHMYDKNLKKIKGGG